MTLEAKEVKFDINSKKEKYKDTKQVEFDGYIKDDAVFSSLAGFDLHYDGGDTYTINKVMADTSIDDTRHQSATVRVTADFAWKEGHPGPDDVFTGQVTVVVVADTTE
ncbi:hypothetical protein [Halocatena pleomorpha]|uniref:Uncharacterized protein n=1 Tax=Halocatena pleomorpha TaxID=1785090 RepID=A0A3P3R834_9EURY|nr:hypothetical protein [Halocatena pleomorpha]RRJ29586.1 hypothetical protein EIK79_13215 [Halocatena pleomorpha]